MRAAATGKKRPYMASHQRRRALLDVAAEIVGRGGWNALTMKGLALEAGVSRQLVYEHFEDATGLVFATLERLFQESHRATAEVLQGSSSDVPATLREAYRIFLEMPAAQRRALRAASGDFVPDRPETHKAIALMRERIFALWLPYAQHQTGLAERELRPLIWMLVSASWGLGDLVDDGTVSKKQATEMFVRFAEQVMVSGRSPRSPGVRRNAGTSQQSRTRKQTRRSDSHE
ncbi:MAG: TetR/AcrR family transcriptional regulator [Planctomycetota bacterium]